MKIKLNAAARLLAEEQKNLQEEALKRRLDIQKEKEEPNFSDKKAMLDTQEQLERTKEQDKRTKEMNKPAGERNKPKPAGGE